MVLEQYLHMEEDCVLRCSPDVGHIRVKSPVVKFDLEVFEGDREWRFAIMLLSNQKDKGLVDRYAWIRLGKPNIDDIGGKFVNELGRDKCEERFELFLRR